MIRAVLFDWGGTLTPFHDLDALELWRAAAQVIAPQARVEELTVALLAAEGEAWAETLGACRSTRTAEIVATALDRTGIAGADLHDAAIESYLQGWAPHTVARPESASVLTTLRASGLKTGMLSNTHWPRHWHENWLERDGLLDLLDTRVYTSELTHLKPHAIAFRTLLDALETEPAEAVFVGDRLIDDISGAHALGMRTVHLPSGLTPRGTTEPTATLPDLTGLPDLIEEWSR